MPTLLQADFSSFSTQTMDYHYQHTSKTSEYCISTHAWRLSLTSKLDKITGRHSKQLRKLNIDSFLQKKQGPFPSFSIKGKQWEVALSMAAEKDKATTKGLESTMSQWKWKMKCMQIRTRQLLWLLVLCWSAHRAGVPLELTSHTRHLASYRKMHLKWDIPNCMRTKTYYSFWLGIQNQNWDLHLSAWSDTHQGVIKPKHSCYLSGPLFILPRKALLFYNQRADIPEFIGLVSTSINCDTFQ